MSTEQHFEFLKNQFTLLKFLGMTFYVHESTQMQSKYPVIIKHVCSVYELFRMKYLCQYVYTHIHVYILKIKSIGSISSE